MSDTDQFFEKVGTAVFNSHDIARVNSSSLQPFSPPRMISESVASCWAQSDNIFYGVSKAHERIPPGVYKCEMRDMIGPVLAAQQLQTDNLIILPDSASEEIVDEIRRFRTRKGKFEALGFLHKRSCLL